MTANRRKASAGLSRRVRHHVFGPKVWSFNESLAKCLLGLLLCGQALGQTSLLELAGEVRDESGIERLVAASFGGGRYYRVEDSPFVVVDLMPTSGIPSTELFVYEVSSRQLVLRMHIPRQPFVVMKAEVRESILVVSQKPWRDGEWEVRLNVMPTVSNGGS